MSFSNVTTMDVGKLDTSKVTDMSYMFYSNSKLSTIKVKDNTAKTFIEARLSDRNITGVTVTPVS